MYCNYHNNVITISCITIYRQHTMAGAAAEGDKEAYPTECCHKSKSPVDNFLL